MLRMEPCSGHRTPGLLDRSWALRQMNPGPCQPPGPLNWLNPPSRRVLCPSSCLPNSQSNSGVTGDRFQSFCGAASQPANQDFGLAVKSPHLTKGQSTLTCKCNPSSRLWNPFDFSSSLQPRLASTTTDCIAKWTTATEETTRTMTPAETRDRATLAISAVRRAAQAAPAAPPAIQMAEVLATQVAGEIVGRAIAAGSPARSSIGLHGHQTLRERWRPKTPTPSPVAPWPPAGVTFASRTTSTRAQ